MNAHAKFDMHMVEEERLKQAMGCFATGVTVVSTVHEGRDHGMTCNSFNTVSLDPAMVLWSIRKESGSHQAFLNGGGYTVSILAEGAVDVARRFTKGAPWDRYEGVQTRRLDSGRLILADAVAWFDCALDNIVSAGDHDVLIGRVLDFSSRPQTDAMVYLHGNFTGAR